VANPGWRQSNLSGNTLQESYKARLARQVGTVPKFQGQVLCPAQRISFDVFVLHWLISFVAVVLRFWLFNICLGRLSICMFEGSRFGLVVLCQQQLAVSNLANAGGYRSLSGEAIG